MVLNVILCFMRTNGYVCTYLNEINIVLFPLHNNKGMIYEAVFAYCPLFVFFIWLHCNINLMESKDKSSL